MSAMNTNNRQLRSGRRSSAEGAFMRGSGADVPTCPSIGRDTIISKDYPLMTLSECLLKGSFGLLAHTEFLTDF